MGNISKIVREVITEHFGNGSNVREVVYFHPDGKTMPNGSHLQRGGFLNECRVNKGNYVLDEAVHGEQYGLAKYKGGVITFSTDVNAVKMSGNKLINKIKQVVETFKQRIGKGNIIHKAVRRFNDASEEHIGAYSVGNFFHGRYVGDSGEMYNEKSVSVEVNGLSSKSLVKLAEYLAEMFRQETVLVKDLNNGKIFLVDSESSDVPLEREMERINTEVP